MQVDLSLFLKFAVSYGQWFRMLTFDLNNICAQPVIIYDQQTARNFCANQKSTIFHYIFLNLCVVSKYVQILFCCNLKPVQLCNHWEDTYLLTYTFSSNHKKNSQTFPFNNYIWTTNLCFSLIKVIQFFSNIYFIHIIYNI